MEGFVEELATVSPILRDVPLDSLQQALKTVLGNLSVAEPTRLASIPAHVLISKGAPAGLSVALNSGFSPQGSDPISEVEAFLWKHGPSEGLTITQIKAAVSLIVKQNWIMRMEKLMDLSMSQWQALREKEPEVTDRVLTMLSKHSTVKPASTMEVFQKMSSVVGQSEDEMICLASRLMQKTGAKTLEDVWSLDEDTLSMLPMAVIVELNRLKEARRLQLKVRPTSFKQVDIPDETNVFQHSGSLPIYVEPTVFDFLCRVGRKIGYEEYDVQRAMRTLVHENWLTSLDIMRQLTERDWDEMYLAAHWTRGIRAGLTDPRILGMTLVYEGSFLPLDVFSSDAEFAVDSLFNLIANKEHLREIVKSFMRLNELLTVYPNDPVKRAIRKTNEQFAATAGRYDCVRNYLLSVGYRDYGTHYLMPILYLARIEEAHSLLAEKASRLFSQGPEKPAMISWFEEAANVVVDAFKNPPFSVTLLTPSRRQI